MPARSGKAYIESLKQRAPVVYLGGRRVADVTGEAIFREPIRAIAEQYDMQLDPAYRDVMTYPSPSTGEPVSTSFLIPRSREDLVRKRKHFKLRTDHNFGFMGRGCESGPSADEKGRSYANLITSPELSAYRIIGMMQPKNVADEIDTPPMLATLRDQPAAGQGGDLSHAEAMLINQASSLQALFVRLSERAMEQAHMPNLEGFMRMALRAQSQCRATVETLALIKNPRQVAFVKQANVTTGPQQINNGTAAPSQARENEIAQDKLLEAQHGERMDTGTKGAAIGTDKAMATVGEINRAEDGRG